MPPELPAMVACERRNMRLTEAGCIRFYQSSNPIAPPVWEGRRSCHLCPVGAARSGAVVDPLQATRERLAPICPRCRRASDRIISGALCISCYNRAAEIRRGRNGKGAPPRVVAGRLFPARVVVIEGGSIDQIETDVSSGPMELALWRARSARGAVSFGWAPGALAA